MSQDSVVLFLGPKDSPLLGWLQSQDEEVLQTSDPITLAYCADHDIGFIISYRYRHILPKDIVVTFRDRAINLHISYLPWNRGTHPNFWSFVDDTPKGVTIHYLDEGVDTGDIIVQQQITFQPAAETLATSYEKLQWAIQELFKEHWDAIKAGKCKRKKQMGAGSYHTARDKDRLNHLLVNGWNTPVSVLGARRSTGS